MKVVCRYINKAFIPLEEMAKKPKEGEEYSCEIRFMRNYKMHKKFFALIKIGCLNSKNVDMPLDVYRKYALIKSGYFTVYVTPKGKFIEADSISFEKMSQEKFEEVYSRVLDFIILDTEADRELIEKELITFM